MAKDTLELIREMQEKYYIAHDQKTVFANDIIDICSTFESECRKKAFEETPAEQVDRENFTPLH